MTDQLQTKSGLGKALDLLDQLEKLKIWYRLEKVRDALMILITIPGERWEVEIFEDGHIEIERFVSDGKITNETTLDELLAEYSAG
jgi:hypothetical protein